MTEETAVARRVMIVGVTDSGTLLAVKVDQDVSGVGPGALAINIQDQHTDVINLLMCSELGTPVLASPIAVEDWSAVFEPGHGFTVGDLLIIRNGTKYYSGFVLVVATNTITVDTPFNTTYIVSDVVKRCSANIALLNGSVTRQTVLSYGPSGADLDITGFKVYIEGADTTAMDDGLFGNISALTRGVVMRASGHGGGWITLGNVKTNSDLAMMVYDLVYPAKAPAGIVSMRARGRFAGQQNLGVTIRLHGGTDPREELQLIIQDDLTGLAKFYVVIQGHVVQ